MEDVLDRVRYIPFRWPKQIALKYSRINYNQVGIDSPWSRQTRMLWTTVNNVVSVLGGGRGGESTTWRRGIPPSSSSPPSLFRVFIHFLSANFVLLFRLFIANVLNKFSRFRKIKFVSIFRVFLFQLLFFVLLRNYKLNITIWDLLFHIIIVNWQMVVLRPLAWRKCMFIRGWLPCI